MRFKVGDRVRIKSLDWYNENKNEYGDIRTIDGEPFLKAMLDFCGLTATIKRIIDYSYKIDVDNGKWNWTDEMIEGLAEEETYDFLETDIYKPDKKPSLNDFMDMLNNEVKLPEGYIFKDENGNVINATKIVLEKKKKEYPKTYEECCKELNIAVRDLDILDNMLDTTEIVYRKNLDRLLNSFRKLLICRDAYWKIAGEEMGLGKPWEPDFDNLSTNLEYIKIVKGCFTYSSRAFAFPTKEMRDAFKENFKSDIEFCKELL